MKRGSGLEANDRIKWTVTDRAFNSRIQSGTIINMSHIDVNLFLDDAFSIYEDQVKVCLNRLGCLKVYTVLVAKFKKTLADGTSILDLKSFIAKTGEIFPATDLNNFYNENVKQITLKLMEEFQEKESNWQLHSILRLDVNFNKYNPMRVGCFIKLPLAIERKKACINVRKEGNECFKWAILSALYQTSSNSGRVKKYEKFEDTLNFTGITFPVTFKDIRKFESQNDVSVNVYGLQKHKSKFTVIPLYLSSSKKVSHVNLLRIEEDYDECEEEDCVEKSNTTTSFTYHFVWIKNLSRLVGKQLSQSEYKKHICDRCLHYFKNEEELNNHIENCIKLNKTKVILPKPGQNRVHFKNFYNKERAPFIIYADCESLLLPATDSSFVGDNTEVFQKHKLLSIGYYLKCYDDTLSVYKASPINEEDAAKWFARELKQVAEDVEPVFITNVPMEVLNATQKAAFKNTNVCHICRKIITHGGVKVRDHCHITGKYRGVAHQDCNLKYQVSKTIPVVFHNLSGYDAHFIIKAIATEFEGNVSLLPINKEKYISFTKHVAANDIKFKFIDSFRFMASSLDKLASYLTNYNIVNSEFQAYDMDKIQLLTRKGIFPYEYLDCRLKLNEEQLPPIEKFYSTLNDSNISNEDYLHAQEVWSAFNCKNIGDYVYLYMKTDILLLADVFENFRDQCLDAYGLDPAHYYTTPGLSWDAMLKYTNVELELLTDIDMIMFIERGIRGGISQCSNRYAHANNHYMKNYNEKEESSYIVYLDANNLYGWAMVQALPYGGFEWVKNIDNTFNFNIPDDSPFGYILEVDLDYPHELHNSHSDLPFCPEHSKPPGSKQSKLLTTLLPKQKYIIHYRALKQALAHGIKLNHIHRILKFKQSTWLKSYIDFNTMMRTNAKNEFEKNLFKLMNNAVYGKTMENVRKHVDVKLVTKWEGRYGAEALISKPNFHTRAIFNDNLIAVELTKTEVYMNKPIYIGLSVLDISKTLMYDFHYNYMKIKYGNNCKLLYTDTDSLVYKIKCADIYSDMKVDICKFDTSDYPANNVYGIPQANKKVLGLMKDECSGKIVTEFVGLRSKMYSLRVEGQDFIKKVKGIKTAVVKKTITFNDYLFCLKNVQIQSRTQYCIRSKLHNVHTLKQTKTALSPFDDKRYLLKNSTDTLAWGHCNIVNHNDDDDVEMLQV
ncbi:uncharacterized protein LOC127282258 [Leptopilina boulardi]|uniref:uncharacterized protein LOC127282258 n=1 Tax=Leptopilina boulardi TaxID=63433 RepID=UPI0021F63C17|nr:uncharacterized protein LOC127282258 [Leptopilina boulardi]